MVYSTHISVCLCTYSHLPILIYMWYLLCYNPVVVKLAYFQLRKSTLHTTFPYTYLKAFKNKLCTDLCHLLGTKNMIC